ncbi:MAG: citrate lyase subunit alpha [Planctomycetota bacterium]|nr:citrate lyase subunit alpha [Planctomycetota bacterium]
MTELVENSIGRLVPKSVNGFSHEPYSGAFADLPPGPEWIAPTPMRQGRGESKLRESLADVVRECVPDGGWVSMPHYYRDDSTALALLLEALKDAGVSGVHLLGIAFFNSHGSLLKEAFESGLLAGVEGNLYGASAKAAAGGAFSPWVVTGRTHGGRARAMRFGERQVNLAVIPVPAADIYGNANGVMGHPGSQCGPVSLAEPDARYSENTVVLTEQLLPAPLVPHPIDMRFVSHVVQVHTVGDSRGISTGSTDIRRVKGDPARQAIADNVLKAMQAAGVIKDGFNFQIGSGAGLLVLKEMFGIMRRNGIRAGFTTGGSMEYHVDLLEEGLISTFFDGQCFQPSARLFHSLINDPRHVEVSTSLYYDPSARQPAVGLMDVVVLGGSEVDRDFNVNTLTGYDGVLRTGIGGGPDAAAGGKLTVFALPLARVNRSGRSAPCVRERVTNVVTPGEVVSAVVTEEHIAVNENCKSPYLPALLENAEKHGLNLVKIDALAGLAMDRARKLGKLMDEPVFTDDIIFVAQWRDGRLIDAVRRLTD